MRFATAIIACVCLATLWGTTTLGADGIPASTSAPSSSRAEQRAVVIELRGDIDEYNKATLVKRFAEARKLGADTIILQINTYGGLVTSGLEISQFLKRQNDLHVIAFIDEKAISAGAMIAIACNEIVMAPGSRLGDCAPIVMSDSGSGLQTLGAAERAKAESPILQDFYDSALRNGYDPTLVQSMVSVGRVVHWVENSAGDRKFVDGPTYETLIKQGWQAVPGIKDPVDAADELLTVGADTAKKLGLAKAIEPSAQSLAADRGMTILSTLAPSAGEMLVGFLGSNLVRGILLSLFLTLLYISFSHPGHGMPEAGAVVALGLLVGVPLLTGYAQWWEIILILIGIVLIALEIFVIPGFGVTGITGIVLLLLGLALTWVGNEPVGIPGILPKLQGTWDALKQGLLIVALGLTCSLLLWFWLQAYLPKLPYFNRLILTTTSGALAANEPESASQSFWPPLGSRGRAMTDLRPGGTASFHDPVLNDARTADVISDSGFVRAGAEVVVREVNGNRIVVRAT